MGFSCWATAQVRSRPSGSPVVPSEVAAQPTLGDDREAVAAAEKWLVMIDAGQHGAAWDVASPHLKSVVTRADWIKGMREARKPFGKFISRSPTKFARSHELPGMPEGDYSIIEFASVFANRKPVTEQMTWALGDGDVWRVAGYYIR